MRKWCLEEKDASMNQVFEVQMWRQVRGPAGAVMCETRDLGIKWPHRHTLIFEVDRRVDMRCVSPKDVKKILVQHARSVYWKKWAAKHEHEELKEGNLAGAGSGIAVEETKRRVVRKASTCGQKIGFGRRLGAEEAF